MGGARILVVQELWWPGGGGLLATHLIAKALAKNGFEVRVVTGTRNYEAIDGVEFVYEPKLEAATSRGSGSTPTRLSREGWFKKLIKVGGRSLRAPLRLPLDTGRQGV
jgi:hypothetical protein